MVLLPRSAFQAGLPTLTALFSIVAPRLSSKLAEQTSYICLLQIGNRLVVGVCLE